MSKKLVKLMTDAPVPLDLDAMDMAKLDVYAVESQLRKLEFRTVLRQLPDVMRVAALDGLNTDSEKSAIRAHGLTIPKKAERLDIKNEDSVYVHAWYDKRGAVSKVGYMKDGKAFTTDQAEKAFVQCTVAKEIVGYDIKRLLRTNPKPKTQNPKSLFDIQIASFMLNSLIRDQSLAGLARELLDLEIEAEDLDEDQKMYTELATIKALHEACVRQLDLAEHTAMKRLFYEVEMPSVPILASMEREGITLDPQYFALMSERLGGLISDLEQSIYGYAEREFNIASPIQLSEVLFDVLGLPIKASKKGKNGAYSTASDVLDRLRDMHPIINLITEYREYAKLKNTYVDPLPTMVDKRNRLHTTFAMTVAQTGRLSSVDPNLQNIPVRTEIGREIRTGFIAREGYVFVSADYSQFELRLAAVLAGDADMIEAFNSDIDIHVLTASQVFGVALEDVTKDMRYAAKAVNFGILYGQTPHGLAQGTGMSMLEAKQFIDKYFESRQPLLDYIKNTKDKAVRDGYVETMFGRRRPTPDVRSSNYMVREGAFRQAINMPVQGTEADLMKMAMVLLEARFTEWRSASLPSHMISQRIENTLPSHTTQMPRSSSTHSTAQPVDLLRPRQLLQIHDSILVECLESDADEVRKTMKDVMEHVYPSLGVKLRVDVSSGPTWGSL
jgi:DNA polymerase I